jgi:hypothetical protein
LSCRWENVRAFSLELDLKCPPCHLSFAPFDAPTVAKRCQSGIDHSTSFCSIVLILPHSFQPRGQLFRTLRRLAH